MRPQHRHIHLHPLSLFYFYYSCRGLHRLSFHLMGALQEGFYRISF